LICDVIVAVFPNIFFLPQLMQNYGVEAARANIIEQIVQVFQVYGIHIDPRHLALVADTMTFAGAYRPMNRLGMRGNASPFLKMSFETTFEFLRTATLSGDSDTLRSHSARLVVGGVTTTGTGSFDLRNPL
jgi:DNA-directed RNA polymerase I subunit RPA1